MKNEAKHKFPEISDLERLKTLLVLLDMKKRYHPEENEFYFPLHKLLSPLRDEFEMDRTFSLLRKETKGNIEAKYEVVRLLSETTGSPTGTYEKNIFVRIKDERNFLKDYKRIQAKQEKETSDKIKKLEIFEPENSNNLMVFVNGDYTNTKITPNKKGKYWGALLTIAKEKNTARSSFDEAKDIANFFNAVPGNILYSRSLYKPPNHILTIEDERVLPLVPIKIFTKGEYSRRVKPS